MKIDDSYMYHMYVYVMHVKLMPHFITLEDGCRLLRAMRTAKCDRPNDLCAFFVRHENFPSLIGFLTTTLAHSRIIEIGKFGPLIRP